MPYYRSVVCDCSSHIALNGEAALHASNALEIEFNAGFCPRRNEIHVAYLWSMLYFHFEPYCTGCI